MDANDFQEAEPPINARQRDDWQYGFTMEASIDEKGRVSRYARNCSPFRVALPTIWMSSCWRRWQRALQGWLVLSVHAGLWLVQAAVTSQRQPLRPSPESHVWIPVLLYNHSVAVYRSRELAVFELLTLDAFPSAPAGVRFRVI